MPRLFLTSNSKGKRIALWTLAGFALSQLALSVYLDQRRLPTRDPVYGHRLSSLQARLAEAPNAPLFLLLGSSRVKYSVCPDAMTIRAAEGAAAPIVYNFGINGLGAIRELMYFRRLLADGIRPTWLLLEIWPPQWAEAGYFREANTVLGADDLHWRDLPLLCRYFRADRDVLRLALQKLCVPIRSYRGRLLDAAVRPLLGAAHLKEMNEIFCESVPNDRNGWFLLPDHWESKTPEALRRAVVDGDELVHPLLDPLRIDERSDAALRELLAEGRRRGIKIALILMPEHSRTRGWYSPQARALIGDYLSRLQHDYPLPIVDARAWMDDDNFADYCHLRRKGVPAISERIGRQVVQPFIEDRPLDNDVLFAERSPETP